MEKKLLNAQKKNFSDQISRITELRNELFPNNTLQERTVNFSKFYCEYGYNIMDILKKNIRPLNRRFSVIEIS